MKSVRSFSLHKLRIIKRRFVQELNDHSVAALKSLKKHKRVCLYFLENPRKKESVVSELTLVGESKKEGVCGLETCTWSCQ